MTPSDKIRRILSRINVSAVLMYYTVLLLCCNQTTGHAQVRLKQSINTDWQFHKGVDTNKSLDWEKVSLPHSWNSKDVMDEAPGYYRGLGIYRKTLYIPDSFRYKEVYLYFEGAAQVAEVLVNGITAGHHTGSYTAFRIPLSAYLKFDGRLNKNEIVVKLDNSHNENIPPLSADFTFFGGIYRDVYLEVMDKVHFDTDNNASDGVFVTTPDVSATSASVNIKGAITNKDSDRHTLQVTAVIIDKTGLIVTRKTSKLILEGNSNKPFSLMCKDIPHPELWSPDHPYLYQVVTTVTDAATNKILDESSCPLGFRWFSFTADKGFFLNGKHLKLWGASRHQDNLNKANALPDALHVKDITLLKAMGANLLRVAHYPQDPAVLEACDRLGIITSVEIPVVNVITENDTFTQNCLTMQREMIRQYFNHPSIMIWAYMNEILLRLRYDDDKPRQEIYFKNVKQLAMQLDSLTRKEDPTRYTMIAFHGDQNLYTRTGLTEVPQIVGWNQYPGWYGTDINAFAQNMDRHNQEIRKPVIVTEYGADGDPRLRGFKPERFDKTLEYETYFHQVYYHVINDRPFISGGMVWNLADFNAEARREAMPHINNKGLLTIDRKPKDVFLYYQSQLLNEPFIRIGSRGWTLRSGVADTGVTSCTQPVAIYTNQTSEVSLLLNGRPLGNKLPEKGIALFDVPFQNGNNQLEVFVAGGRYKDVADITFKLIPQKLQDTVTPFTELNVSLGDQRFFNDDVSAQVWLPEQAYRTGGWGYIGGSVFKLKHTKRQPYGSDKDILGTDDDPIYETQREGIEQFRLDVPEGRYEVTFHFAELLSSALRDANIYNLENGHNKPLPETPEERSFDVLVNGNKVIHALGSDNYLVPEQAYSTKVYVNVKGNEGILIDFKALKGKTILNGLQVRKIY